MATAVLISVEEYLNTSYDPDCDYVDGEVVERNLGETKHSKAQRRIIYYLGDHYTALRDRIYPEQRVQVKPNRFRIPDLCITGITAVDAPDEEIFRTPPELCIEILSPKDTMTRTLEKIKDYFQMGVPLCWILDPVARQGWIATPGKLEDAADGVLRAGTIEMPVRAVLE